MKLRHDMLTHGVNIVTAAHGSKRGGLAVAWATQTSTDRVLICVGSQSWTRQLILDAKAFGLNVLRKDQKAIAGLFGRKSSKDVDKFEKVRFHTLETGSPLLDDCALALDCIVVDAFDVNSGKHKLILGQVVAAEQIRDEFEPLIYREADFE